MTKVLITGAGGFIGQHLATAFASRGCHVLAIYRGDLMPERSSIGRAIQWIRRDIADGLEDISSVDMIVHAAAAHPNSRFPSGLSDYHRTNVVGTMRIMEYAIKVGAKFVLNLSSISLYGDVPGGELSESTPMVNPSVYGASKYFAELIVREYAGKINSMSVRLPGVVGPRYFTPWIGRVLSKALRGEMISIYNPDAKFNNIIDVDELDRFSAHILQIMPAGADAVNMGASKPSTIDQVVRLVVEMTGSRSAIVSRPSSVGSFHVNTEKLEHLGFTPLPTLAVVRRYVDANLGPPMSS